MFKILVFILFSINVNVVYGNKLEVDLQPKEPILGESFNVTFKIITQDGTDPIINFNPGAGIEVLGREEAGITTSTSYINGHLSVERSMSIVYEMVATGYGTKYLKDISVDINGTKITHPNLRISVLKQAQRPKDIIAIAEVDKSEAFIGESILVRYYLYNKVTVNNFDIKKFPKLGKFLKRYHQEKMTAQRVRHNGEIYTRRVLYTAQLFMDKPGDYKIDPITLRIQYYSNQAGNYNNFGFGFRRQMSTTITSKPIIVKVKQLPLDNMPANFTGLVGKHSFKLMQNKSKFLVNDPIELKVVATGEGALELFEMPSIYKDPNIEEFDSSNELEVGSDFSATKTFNITLLGRSAVKLPETAIPLSYFDPQKMEYVTEILKLKAITVAGASQYVPSQGHSESKKSVMPGKSQQVNSKKKDLTPLYTFTNSYLYSSRYINLGFGGLVIILLSMFGIKKVENMRAKEPDFYKQIKKDGVNFGRLHSLVLKLGRGNDMREIISKSQLNQDSKKYFIGLVELCEKDYASDGKKKTYKVKNKYLKDVMSTIEEQDDHLS